MDTRRTIQRARPIVALAAAGMLAGCAGGGVGRGAGGPEGFELANIDDANILPKSSPAQFVGAFARFCLDTADADRPGALRGADYVAFGRARSASRVRTFVVDDRRPAVMLGGGGDCAVAAEARTGQSARAARLIAERFPAARPIEPGGLGPNAETAWLSRPGGPVIQTLRQIRPGQPSRYMLALVHSN